ncbi:MAG: hypothetical protein QME32_00870 [Endomicrobiia bacterium]|nr:hypothetical protein [Endomicrobiia bacterium]
MVKKIVLWAAGALLIIAILTLARAGFFTGVRVEEKEVGHFILVYKKGEGAYKNSASVMTAVYDKLVMEKIETDKGFGYYYDDPRKVPAENLRWIAGYIVDNEKAAARAKKYFQVKKFPATRALTAEFPLKGKLSILAGIIKVYPAMKRHAVKKGFPMAPVMEIYDGKSKKITYVTSLDPEFDAIGFYEPKKPAGAKKQASK